MTPHKYLLKISDEKTISTLGMTWQPSIYSYRFVFKDCSPTVKLTKRTLLSDMNKIFDPIDLLSPVFIKGKIFLQQLWAMKRLELSLNICKRWEDFYITFKNIEKNKCSPNCN
jgi:hypothetical protein